MKTRTIVLLPLFVFLLSEIAYSWPIEPRPLRRLVLESELIVVAKVKGTRRPLFQRDFWNTAIATLQVEILVKGHSDTRRISVHYWPDMACPEPARYVRGETVLAFLNRREKGSGYNTCGASYGAKSLSKSDMKVYVARIRDLEAISKVADSDERTSRTVEWLVKCVENKVTRWEGLFDLDGSPPKYSWDSPFSGLGFHRFLTDTQKARLLSVLQKTGRDQKSDPNHVTMLMSVLARTANRAELVSLTERLRASLGWDSAALSERQKNIVSEFVKRYKGPAAN